MIMPPEPLVRSVLRLEAGKGWAGDTVEGELALEAIFRRGERA